MTHGCYKFFTAFKLQISLIIISLFVENNNLTRSVKMSQKGVHIVNGESTSKPEPTKLCRFQSPLSVSEQIEQTSTYAKDPKAYLESKLGKAVFDERKDLLCVPEDVDKDMYGAGTHKSHFQQHIATLFGKEDGLFFITGVQAQLAALKIHCRTKKGLAAWHITSHLESAEERAFKELYGLDRVLLGTSNDKIPTVDEIKSVLSLPESQRPAIILVELPNRELGCKTYTFSELQQISKACAEAGVKLHLDGARIWEIEPYYQKTAGKTFADIASLFDSAYVSFYKGLRSYSAGAMLLGDSELIKEAKVWQRRAGGNAFTLFYDVIDCERSFNLNIGTFDKRWKKVSAVQERVMSATEQFKTAKGEKIVDFIAVPATCCQVRTLLSGFTTEELVAARDKVEQDINVRVFERVRPKQTLDEMTRAERNATLETGGNNVEKPKEKVHEIEWFVGEETLTLDTDVFVDGYFKLCEELLAAK